MIFPKNPEVSGSGVIVREDAGNSCRISLLIRGAPRVRPERSHPSGPTHRPLNVVSLLNDPELQRVGPRNGSKPFPTRLHAAALSRPIDLDDSKSRPIAEGPFEIIHEAPIGVTPNIDAVGDA